MGTISTSRRNSALRDEIKKIKIKVGLRSELVQKDFFTKTMKGMDARFELVDQRFGHLEMKIDERFKRTDLKINALIGLVILTMTVFNPTFMDVLARLLK